MKLQNCARIFYCFAVLLLSCPVENFQLPDGSARSTGYNLDAQNIKRMLNEELSPLKSDLDKLLKTLNGDTQNDQSQSDAPRFTQKAEPPNMSSPLTENTQNAPVQMQQFQNLGLTPEALNFLNMIPSMFQNQNAVRSMIPAGTPALSPDRIVDMISSALSQAPEENKQKLERLLLNSERQLMNGGGNFLQMMPPTIPTGNYGGVPLNYPYPTPQFSQGFSQNSLYPPGNLSPMIGLSS